MKSTTLERKRTPTAGTDKPTDIHALLRQLLKQVRARRPGNDASRGHGESVILDMEVDGFRCRLVRAASAPEGAVVILSPREREIARMVAKGYPNKTIAGVLEISAWTVGTYLRRIFAKLGVGSRAAMVARLMECGLLRA
jgi:DNA-binding CsgD family transcriptional regulator